MKIIKFVLVYLVFAGVASCSNDDDSNSDLRTDGDRIVGEWKIQSQITDGEVGELTDCELLSRIRFTANGDVNVTDRYDDFTTEDCLTEIYTQKWEYLGNNVYRITDEDGSNNVTIIFSNNDNAFTVSREDADGSFSATYVRV